MSDLVTRIGLVYIEALEIKRGYNLPYASGLVFIRRALLCLRRSYIVANICIGLVNLTEHKRSAFDGSPIPLWFI